MLSSRSIQNCLPRLVVVLLIAAVWVAPARAAAAQVQPELIDRIIAIVGDTAVLQSELQEQVFRLRAQGTQIPNDRGQLRQLLSQILRQRISEVLVVLHAVRAGVTVTEDEVNQLVDERVQQIRRQFPTEVAFQQALQQAGMTAAEFRIQITDQSRAELLTQRYLGQRVSELQPVPISEEEVRERFEAQKASLGPKPAMISLQQIVLLPRPSEDADLEARATAERALSRARSGEDFARLAREYSDDPGSRDKGGELGWMRRGNLLPEFERVLFDMRPGEISDIVETVVGYHIIKLDRVRGAERFSSHILISPTMTAEDEARTMQLAEEVAVALRQGADIDSLSNLYHDPQEQTTLTRFPQEQLPSEYRTALAGTAAGDIVGPFRIPAPALPVSKVGVLAVRDISPGGDWVLDDVRDTIRQQLQQDGMLEQVIQRLQDSTYIESRDEALDDLANILFAQLNQMRTGVQ